MSFDEELAKKYLQMIQSAVMDDEQVPEGSSVIRTESEQPPIWRYPLEDIALPSIVEPNVLHVDVEGIFFEQLELDRLKDLPASFPLQSSKPQPISSVIILVKKAIRRMIRFCLVPICHHQTLFNNYTAGMLRKINPDLQNMRYQQKVHTDELQHLTAAVRHISQQLATQVDHTFNQLEEQMEWVSRSFQNLSNRLEGREAVLLQKVSGVERNTSEMHQQISEIENENAGMHQQITNIENSNAHMQENMDVTMQKIAELEAALHTMEQQLSMAFQKTSIMEDAVAQMDAAGLRRSNSDGRLSFAQSGEDSIIHYILKAKGIPVEKATYLDLGANHAKEISNTYSLYCAGARGVLLEANPALIPELRLYRSEDIILHKCLCPDDNTDETLTFYVMNGDGLSTCDRSGAEEAIRENPTLEIVQEVSVKGITMKEIINTYFNTPPFMVNLDVEGIEIDVLNSIDFESWRPLIFIIETIPYHPRLIIEEKREDIVSFMQARGYAEYAFTGINSIFIDKRQMI